MKLEAKYLIVTSLFSLACGSLAIAPVVMSESAYVGSIVFLPVLILVLIVAAIVFVAGIIVLASTKKLGPYVLLFAILLPVGFFIGATVSKYLELGAYRIEPMVPFEVLR